MKIKSIIAVHGAAWVATLMLWIVAAAAGSEDWFVQPALTTGHGTDSHLQFQFTLHNDSVVYLNLRPNYQMPKLPDLYAIGKEGLTRLTGTKKVGGNDVTLYQDREARAALMVAKIRGPNSTVYYSLSGTFSHGCGMYSIWPRKIEAVTEHLATNQAYDMESGLIVHSVQLIGGDATGCTKDSETSLLSIPRSSYAVRNARKMEDKRQYVIEMAYVVDSLALKMFPLGHAKDEDWNEALATNDLNYYFWHIANTVDLMLSAIEHPQWTLRARLTRLFLLKTPFVGNLTDGSSDEVTATGRSAVGSHTVLAQLRDWYMARQSSIPEDHVALFTGHKLYDNDTKSFAIGGVGYKNGICNSYRVVVVEVGGAFQEAIYHLHELGHNLGAPHDGENEYEVACPANQQFVMTPFRRTIDQPLRRNPSRFSWCSLREINLLLETLNSRRPPANCLSEENFRQSRIELGPTDGVMPPGQVYTADDQCQQVRGAAWRACPTRSASLRLCYSLRCYDSKTATTPSCPTAASGVQAAEGTSCGDSMWCTMGECVFSDSAPAVARAVDCANGEWPRYLIEGENHTCATMPRSWCYKSVVRDACCATCPRYADPAKADCEFGDRGDDCSTRPLTQCASRDVRKRCCERCKDTPMVGPECDGPDYYRSCAVMASRGFCYANLTRCCQTCAARYDASAPPNCTYGDRDDSRCSRATVAKCRLDDGTCCRTCPALLALSVSKPQSTTTPSETTPAATSMLATSPPSTTAEPTTAARSSAVATRAVGGRSTWLVERLRMLLPTCCAAASAVLVSSR